MVIDIHTHVGKDKDGTSQTLKQLMDSMQKNKVSLAVVFPFDEKEKDVLEASLDLLKHKTDSIIPLLRVNPNSINVEELKRILKSFAGVKLHPRSENFDPLDKNLYHFYTTIENSRKFLLIHTRKENNQNTDPDRIALLAKDFPKLNIVLAHFAMASSRAMYLVGKYENLYIDTSIVSSPRLIEMAVTKVGADKLIFGSDSPYSDQEIELLKIKKANILDSEKEKILIQNAKKILNL